MNLNFVSSVLVIGALVLIPTSAQARSINHLVSASALSDYCSGRQAGREYSVQLTRNDGTTISGKIECAARNSTGTSWFSNDRDDDDDRYGRHDDDRNDRHDDDRNDRHDDDHDDDHDNDHDDD